MVLQIQRYFIGEITLKALIKLLTYKEPTHQICFCTVKSLYALELISDKKFQLALDEISAKIIENIVGDNKLSDMEATDIFLTSAIYAKLASESTLLWQKPWQDIYKMFEEELIRTTL